ncbi:hypothetical protein PENTCL1PPCAC_4547, partial [Pristionchus entomophagus]
ECNCPGITSRAQCYPRMTCSELIKDGCAYSCPEGSTTFYWTLPDTPVAIIPKPSFKCKAGVIEGFPVPGLPAPYGDGALCLFDPNSDLVLPNLPEGSLCEPLDEYTADSAVDPVFDEIRYVKDRGDYYATCRQGVIISPGNPGSPLKIRCVDGIWEGGVVQATCAAADDQFMPSCLENADPGPDFEIQCMTGTCQIICRDLSKVIEYTDKEGEPRQSELYYGLGCVDGEATSLNGEQIDGSKFH